MPKLRILSLIVAIALAGAPSLHAEESVDQKAIHTVIHAMFDRPDAELIIEPVTVESDFAVAGWVQGEMGGRAFLHREAGNWVLLLCTGDEILSSAALQQSGMSAEAADRMLAAITEDEKTVAPERLRMFASFQGIMRMDGN